jgi:type II secretory pathway pseudopilin PulG
MTPNRESGMTLIELMVIVCIICVLATIGALHLMRARSRGFESSAVASLRLIAQGQVVYSVACGFGGFAPNLPVLARPSPGSNAPFIPIELTTTATAKSAYRFAVRPAHDGKPYQLDCNGTRNTTAYYASAQPVQYSLVTGSQSFAVSLNGVIWALNSPTPPAEPFGPPAQPFR